VRVHVFLVLPVRGDAVLRALVHAPGADLQLDRLAAGPMTVVCSDWYMLNFGIAT
jgi:hypothetical protein